MNSLSWPEIRQNAIQFSRAWGEGGDERADAQTFWNEFFEVFGLRRRTVASFEAPVKNLRETYGRIDLLWKGVMLAEHKSAGQDLDKAESQAFQYIQDLKNQGREDEIPRYVVLSNFRRIVLFDLEPDDGQMELPLWQAAGPTKFLEFELKDFHKHIRHFGFFIGQRTHRFGVEDEANLRAAELMARLHDEVAESRYDHKSVERLLVRILFCLFAEDTAIFEPNQFSMFVENRTLPNGTDLGQQLNAVFDVLNTPPKRRPKALDEELRQFPFVNGKLFEERLPLAAFTPAMRTQLIHCCNFDWSRISPAIFGSLFQGIMDPADRRKIGAHYTSERDILKVVQPLFLDELRAEYKTIKADTRKGHRETRLRAFWEKLSKLKFFDPACGCGNFLVVAYRELRKLELEVIQSVFGEGKSGQLEELKLGSEFKLSQVDVDQFYGIELGEWPARIAETALWLTDHQMNQELSVATGHFYQRIPLKASPTIFCYNALRLDWSRLLPPGECSYILGNPPFIGSKFQDYQQKTDVDRIAAKIKNHGLLDYVAMWYLRAIEYIQGTSIACAFVSTNSISQGEQVGILWEEMFRRGARIHFAHRPFAWESEAKGKAHVHVVIIGFGTKDRADKAVYEYDDLKGEATRKPAWNVSPYLLEGGNFTISNRSQPISNVPEMDFGNQPIDGGHLILDPGEAAALRAESPAVSKYIRRFVGAHELLHGVERYCLWLVKARPNDVRTMPGVQERLKKVTAFRLASKREATRELAASPSKFAFVSHKDTPYLIIPSVTSERRRYIPIGFMPADVIASNLCLIINDGKPFHFGILTSAMHMAWLRQVCGRLESRYRYSAKLVYNNFPWPPSPSAEQRRKVEEAAERVLAARQEHLDGLSTLADLYDPLVMPYDLLKAHRELDRAVDRCYRKEKFISDRERVEFLFGLYAQITMPLAPSEEIKPKRRKKAE